MCFEVDRYSSAWAHIALCADLTWTAEPPDEFIIANQRLWAQHCRVAQVLQDNGIQSQSQHTSNACELAEKRPSSSQIQENGSFSGRRSVKDVIPESRLAQYYGNFYYDEAREKCYTSENEKFGRGLIGHSCENSDLTECWMLPEVEYWFRKLVDEPPDRSLFPRRRRHFRMLADDDFERWGSNGGDEAVLAARVLSVRPLWESAPAAPHRTPSPPPTPRKMRARRRQPRRLAALAPPPPAYCLHAPPQLFCDPSCKFQFELPRPPQVAECQRAMGRLSASVQAVMRAAAARCPPYRGTNVSRYAPTSRYGAWWPRGHPSTRLQHRFQFAHVPRPVFTAASTTLKNQPQPTADPQKPSATTDNTEPTPETLSEVKDGNSNVQTLVAETSSDPQQTTDTSENQTTSTQKEKVVTDGQEQSTSSAATDLDTGLIKRRLYSTVLSMSAPSPLNISTVGCVRLARKLVTPGLLKLNSKIMLPTTRVRPPNVDNKFEELEKEALEQYKASDESIDTKFRELEKEAAEQYSNSNTSCSSGQSAEKRPSKTSPDSDPKQKQPANFHKDKAVDSVVVYSQNFPELNVKGHTASVTNLKNFHTPLRGEKRELTHRSSKTLRNLKSESQRAASDTDYDCRETNQTKGHKGPLRWTLGPPKKRHLTMCASDFSSDEEPEQAGFIRPRIKHHVAGKVKLAAHGGGDPHPIMRKT